MSDPAPTPAQTRLAIDPATGRLAPFHIFLRCTENDVEDDYDGGKVLLQAIKHQDIADLNGCNLVLSLAHDDPMLAFPSTRADKAQRWYRATVEEIDCPIPPDPTAPIIETPEQRVARLEAELAAARTAVAPATADAPTPPADG